MKAEFSISFSKASKRASFFLAVVGGLLFFLSSCQDDEPPTYPVEPHIEFVKAEVIYADIATSSVTDILSVTVRYQDGDGDLGLISTSGQFPYHEATFFKRQPPHDTVLNIANYKGELLRLGDKPGGLDTLPEYEKSSGTGEDCINYRILWREGINDYEADTVYQQLNENFHNFFFDIFIKEQTGFEHYDFRKETCVPSHGRFRNDGNGEYFPFVVEKASDWEGTIQYNFELYDLSKYFGGDSIKLKIYIKDRNLNKSNVVESSVLYIQE